MSIMCASDACPNVSRFIAEIDSEMFYVDISNYPSSGLDALISVCSVCPKTRVDASQEHSRH